MRVRQLSFAFMLRDWIKVALVVLIVVQFARAKGEGQVDYIRDVRPILSNNCFKCHGPDEAARKADLRLDTEEDAVADRGGYRAINRDEPAASEVLNRITTMDADERMPPADTGLQLTSDQIDIFRRWVEQGAPIERHWALRPIEKPPVPTLNSSAVRNPIDAFVVAKLSELKIEPSPAANRNTLIRRVYLDVLGLPLTPKEVEEFVADRSPDAYEKMVDRALASPHYGERWGRHWLDQARYADTNGYSVDAERSMWPYRDWVIKALNNDMPFDQFTIEQLAGDLLPNPTRDQLVATGFHRNTLINEEGGTDAEQFRVEEVVDRVNTTGTVWLGLTIGCAQCHTHKFDPISQHEYYRLFAFFNNCEDANTRLPILTLSTLEQDKQLAEFDGQIALATKALAAYDEEHKAKSDKKRRMKDASKADDDDPRAKLAAEVDRLQAEKKKLEDAIPQSMILRELTKPRESHLLIRGDFLRKGDRVEPDTPALLPKLAHAGTAATRLDLARWLVSRENPLTARVTVNRVWAHYFGQGLVETENDFGLQGTPPSHPELLDWLAAEFMDEGWSLKRLHRLILNSATYRHSSKVRPDLITADPLNKLLARQSRLRVDAEIVRDLGLSVSGLLCETIGGPSVRPPQPDDVLAFTQIRRAWPVSTGGDRYRRGMYTFFMRSAPFPMLVTFDMPVFNVTCTFRQRSNTPLQSLSMANDETMIEMARALGQRVLKQAVGDPARVALAYQLCFARPADSFEVERLSEYLDRQRHEFDSSPANARKLAGDAATEPVGEAATWTSFARVLLNLDEFVTRE
jgi:hypothetical protein